jgi:hypothetical protein
MPAGLPLAADDVKPHPGGWIQAEWLKGRPVVNATGKEMGKIEEVWMDPKDGRDAGPVVAAVGQPALGA